MTARLARLVFSLSSLSLCLPPDLEEPVKRAVVMLRCVDDNDRALGAGVIYAFDEHSVRVLTADHFIVQCGARPLFAQVRWDPGEWAPAKAIRRNTEHDIAALVVDHQAPSAPLALNLLSPPFSILRGHQVRSIGNPSGQAWRAPVTADSVLEVTKTGTIVFENKTKSIEPGSSGGALLDSAGRISGIVLKQLPEQALSEALSIHHAIELLRQWQEPVSIRAHEDATVPMKKAGGEACSDEAKELAADASDEGAIVRYAVCLDSRGFHDEAIAQFDRAIAISPRLWTYFVARGHAKQARGLRPEAASDLRRATELAPEEWKAWYELGILLEKQENLRRSILALETAGQLAAGLPEPHCALGRVMRKAGTTAAAEFYERKCKALTR